MSIPAPPLFKDHGCQLPRPSPCSLVPPSWCPTRTTTPGVSPANPVRGLPPVAPFPITPGGCTKVPVLPAAARRGPLAPIPSRRSVLSLGSPTESTRRAALEPSLGPSDSSVSFRPPSLDIGSASALSAQSPPFPSSLVAARRHSAVPVDDRHRARPRPSSHPAVFRSRAHSRS